MRIERYIAPTMNEALSKVKADLGDDAVILKTRKTSSKGGSGSLPDEGSTQSKKQMIEVTAALDDREPVQTQGPSSESHSFGGDRLQRPSFGSELSKVYGNRRNGEQISESQAGSSLEGEIEKLRGQLSSQVEDLSESIEDISHQIRYKDASYLSSGSDTAEIFAGLLNNGVDEKIVRRLHRKVKKDLQDESWNASSVKSSLSKRIKQMIKTSKPVQKTGLKRVFLGPNGSGKTTAISKLAVKYKTDTSKDIAIVSADTYRAGAFGQIEGLAKIIDIPAWPVYSPEEMKRALESFRDKDLILIDTPGASNSASEVFEELQRFIEQIEPDEVHVVLSASNKPEDQVACFDRFKVLSADRILLTRLCETEKPGTILNLIDRIKKPISYTTSDPSITGDIKRTDPACLADLIMK